MVMAGWVVRFKRLCWQGEEYYLRTFVASKSTWVGTPRNTTVFLLMLVVETGIQNAIHCYGCVSALPPTIEKQKRCCAGRKKRNGYGVTLRSRSPTGSSPNA